MRCGDECRDYMYNFIKKRQESPVKHLEDKDALKQIEEKKLAILVVMKEHSDSLVKTLTDVAY